MPMLLGSLSDRYDVILCDLWGCLHNGVTAFKSAAELLREWRAQGCFVILVTNAPRPSSFAEKQLHRLGIPTESYDTIVSSGDIGIRALQTSPEKGFYFFIGSEVDREIYQSNGFCFSDASDVRAVLCTGFDEKIGQDLRDYEAQFREFSKNSLEMYCLNPDRIVHRGGQEEICAGTLARRYESFGGKVHYFGKPYKNVYNRCFELYQDRFDKKIDQKAILAIGDSLLTDFQGALSLEIDFLFVRSGIEAKVIQDVGIKAFLEKKEIKEGRKALRNLYMVEELNSRITLSQLN